MRSFLHYLSYLRYTVLPVSFLLAVSFCMSLALVFVPGLQKMLFDKLFVSMDTSLLAKYIGISLFLLIYDIVFSFLLSLFEVSVQYTTANRIKMDFTHKLFRTDYSFFQTTDSGALIKRVIEDSDEIAVGIIKLISCLCNLLNIIIIGIILYTIQSWILLLYAVLICCSLGWTLFWTIPSLKYSSKIGTGYAQLYGYYWETFPGIATIKAYGLYETVSRNLDKIQTRLRKYFLTHTLICAILWQISHIFPWVGFTVILTVGLASVEQGTFSLGIFYALIGMLWILFDPLQEIFKGVSFIHAGITAAQRAESIRTTTIEHSGNIPFTQFTTAIAFRDVCLSYTEAKTVLTKFNLIINKGDKVSLVGATGSGKTSLAHLLLKLYTHYTGFIAIDNKDLRDYNTDTIRNKIVLIPQQPHLFPDTVRNNIDVHKILSDDAVFSIIQKVNLEAKIGSLPRGLDTVVGEQGEDFSGGERQRICIARAMTQNPEIIIFDEVTSSLDSENEERILLGLMEMLCDKTIINISHRQSTILHGSYIYVLKDGVIAEAGTHEELTELNNEYCRLFNRRPA